jgi:hypothetical protein
VWAYLALAALVVVLLKLLGTILFATERVAASRADARENRALRARLERYTAR